MKLKLIKLSSLLLLSVSLSAFLSTSTHAHTDHDRARFVAEDGTDAGDCKNRFRPCASIAYAAKQANKGDTLLVAEGKYNITSVEDIFYLTSDIVPALGGFQPLDNYQVQNPSLFPTTLVGVPVKYADTLYKRGFNVIADTKSLSETQTAQLTNSLTKAQAMFESQAQTSCVNGQAGSFACQGMSLLSHIPVSDLPTGSNAANDIWGHIDLNTMKEYALLGMRRGIVVIDVSDPVNPAVVGSISGQSTTWRDIKVYQYFSNTLNQWQAFAYATADSASEGLTIIDLNDLENGISLVTRLTDDPSSHNIYISGIDYSLNIANASTLPRVHILGAQARGGSLKTYILNNPRALRNSYNLSGASRQDYTHDASSLLINDERASRDCSNATSEGCIVMVDFNEDSMRLWDHTQQDASVELSEIGYDNSAYAHSGWWTEDKQYVFLHDEIDEQRFGLNTTVHVFDISSLTNPRQVATWTGPTRAIDHNGFVRGNKYYMSNYERGVTILDISDPTAPQEIGYFDTYPNADGANFNGNWGVYPYLPSGIILASDIQGGLYVLADETDSADKANIAFSALTHEVFEGQTLALEVTKQGSQAASIQYEIILGSAESADIDTALTGTLTWSIDDETSQVISIPAVDDGSAENAEQFFVRLFNPSADSELGGTSITSVTLNSGDAPAAVIAFDQDLIIAREIDGQLDVVVNRTGSSTLAAQVEVAIDDSATSAADYELLTPTLEWAANDTTSKVISILLVDDTENEVEETLILTLSAGQGVTLPTTELSITILDDDSNEAPTVTLPSNQNVNTRQTVSVVATGADPEGATLTYSWSQTSGDIVSINDPTASTISFVAPTTAQTIVMEVGVSDNFGKTASAGIEIVVAAPAAVETPPASSGSSSGGSLSWFYLMAMGLFAIRRCMGDLLVRR